MIGTTDPVAAWCFDEATFVFGSSVESFVSDARSNAKGNSRQRDAAAENALRRMLGLPGKFRAPPKPKG